MTDQKTYEVDQDTPPEPMPTPGNFGAGQDVEVDPELALEEAKTSDAPFVTPEASAAEEEQEDVLDLLRPKAEPREWTFGPDEMKLTYVQRPLSFVAKMQWFALVGDALEKSMSGDNGISIADLDIFSPVDGNGLSGMSGLREADTFVRAMAKLVVHAPNFLTESYSIWLNIPDHERQAAKTFMALPEDRGGLTDDQGIAMIEVFIDQNFDALADFFGSKLRGLQQRVQQRQEDRKKRTKPGA